MNKAEFPKGDRRRCPEQGWACDDWIHEALACMPNDGKAWERSELSKDPYLTGERAGFIAGVVWAACWFAEGCSGGRFREVARHICQGSADVMMLQRFLEHAERMKPTESR